MPLRLIVISMLPAFSIKSELQRLNVHAVWTNHYFEIAGFAYKLQIGVVEFEHRLANFKLNGFGLAGIKVNTLKAFQLLDGTDYRSGYVVDVELNNLISCTVSGIRYGERCSYFSVLVHGVCAQ